MDVIAKRTLIGGKPGDLTKTRPGGKATVSKEEAERLIAIGAAVAGSQTADKEPEVELPDDVQAVIDAKTEEAKGLLDELDDEALALLAEHESRKGVMAEIVKIQAERDKE